MSINLNNINKIEDIYTLLIEINNQCKNNYEKRWLNTAEVVEYTGFSQSTIKNLKKEGELVEGIHYFRKTRNSTFDKEKIDEWIMEGGKVKKEIISHNQKELIMNNILNVA